MAAPKPRDEPVTRADLPLRLKRSRIRSGSFPAWAYAEILPVSIICERSGEGAEIVVKSLERQDLSDGLEGRLAALYFNEPSTGACVRGPLEIDARRHYLARCVTRETSAETRDKGPG
jgi:hypothetical protein